MVLSSQSVNVRGTNGLVSTSWRGEGEGEARGALEQQLLVIVQHFVSITSNSTAFVQ